MEYTVTLTRAEYLAFTYLSLSPQDWIDNAVHTRASRAIDEIVQVSVEKCLENNIQVPGSKDEIVELAFEKGWVLTASQVNQQVGSLQTS